MESDAQAEQNRDEAYVPDEQSRHERGHRDRHRAENRAEYHPLLEREGDTREVRDAKTCGRARGQENEGG